MLQQSSADKANKGIPGAGNLDLLCWEAPELRDFGIVVVFCFKHQKNARADRAGPDAMTASLKNGFFPLQKWLFSP